MLKIVSTKQQSNGSSVNVTVIVQGDSPEEVSSSEASLLVEKYGIKENIERPSVMSFSGPYVIDKELFESGEDIDKCIPSSDEDIKRLSTRGRLYLRDYTLTSSFV